MEGRLRLKALLQKLWKPILLTVLFSIFLSFPSPTFGVAGKDWSSAGSNYWLRGEGHSAVVHDFAGSKMWIMGGYHPDNETYSGMVCYSSDGSNWSSSFTFFDSRAYHAAVVFKGMIWVMGGYDGKNYKNDVWYSVTGTSWTKATDSARWLPRAHHSAVVFDNKIWVMGGYNPDKGYLNDVWCSSDGINWVENGSFSGPRAYHSSVVFKNKMWVIGGYGVPAGYPTLGFLNTVLSSSNGSLWDVEPSLPSPRAGHSSVVFDNKLWVIGGESSPTSFHNDALYFDGSSWNYATDNAAFSSRCRHSSLVFKNKMWVMGGTNPKGPVDDVWYSNSDIWNP